MVAIVFFGPAWGDESLQQKTEEVRRLADEGKMNEAIDKLKDVLKTVKEGEGLDPVRLQYDLANLLFLEKRYEEARRAYEEVIRLSERNEEVRQRSLKRIEKMQERDSKKGDKIVIRLIDIETLLDTGQRCPEGTKKFLSEIEEGSDHYARAQQLLSRLMEDEDRRARERLDHARHLFDETRDYREVLRVLESIEEEFPTASEMPSVMILKKEAIRKLGG